MGTQAELIKDCKRQIQIYELMLKLDPGNKSLVELLEKEKALLDDVKLAK